MELTNKPPSLSSQLRTASSILSRAHHRTIPVAQKYRVPKGKQFKTLLYKIIYPPEYFDTYRTISRFQAFIKEKCPQLIEGEFEFYAYPRGQTIYILHYHFEDALSIQDETFLQQSKKIFSPQTEIFISFP